MTPDGWKCPHCGDVQAKRADRCGWCEDEVEMKPLYDRDVVVQAAIEASSADNPAEHALAVVETLLDGDEVL